MENVIGTFVKLNVPEKGMELVHAWARNWRIAHAYIKDIKIISLGCPRQQLKSSNGVGSFLHVKPKLG
ncbi:hypothetical protein YC2023_055782 [Brassica napus]